MKPILFNTEMVGAILDGHKSVTRRVVKPQPVNMEFSGTVGNWARFDGKCSFTNVALPYRSGDILYVREPWRVIGTAGLHALLLEFRHSGKQSVVKFTPERYKKFAKFADKNGWQSPYFLPKEVGAVAGIYLRVKDARVEQLQDISDEQCEKEGLTAKQKTVLNQDEYWYWFKNLWDSTLKKQDLPLCGWDANPWVWVIEFERISKEEADHEP